MEVQNLITKKNIILATVALLLLVLVVLILNTTFIKIEAPKDSTITLLGTDNEVVKKEITTGELFYMGRVGDYTVKISRLDTEKQKIIKAGPLLNTVKTDLPADSEYSTNPVAPVNTTSFYINSDHLVYLDSTSQSIKSITKDNPQPVTVSEGYKLNNIKWSSNGSGITYDQETGNLYLVDNKYNFSKLHTPDDIRLTSDVYYQTTADGTIYISENNTVYSTNNLGKDYKKLTTTDQKQVQIYPSSGGDFIIVDYPLSQSDKLEDPVANIVSYDKNGKKQAEIKEVTRFNISISPDGNQAAIYSSQGYQSRESDHTNTQEASKVVSTKDFKTLLKLPTNNNPFFAWSNNSTLYYASEREVWKVSLGDDNLSELVTRIPYGRLIQSLAWVNNGLYISNYFSNDLASISKVVSTKPDETMRALEINLPAEYDDCVVTYVNIANPFVAAYPKGNSGANCSGVAKDYLDLIKLQLDGIRLN